MAMECAVVVADGAVAREGAGADVYVRPYSEPLAVLHLQIDGREHTDVCPHHGGRPEAW